MAESVRLLPPSRIKRNPENPRLIFRKDELRALEKSIASQGILVPLTVFAEKHSFRLLDGERRWRCAIKLGLPTVPVVVQPRPDKLRNIMMMFAIHNARKDWDPLPTAYKLQELEDLFHKQNARRPSEIELAELASISRGEVRRLKKLLGLPDTYRQELMQELEKPRSQQIITVDHVLEATKAAAALRKRAIVDEDGEERLRRAIVDKFKSGVIVNTVAPRKLARLARAVDRNEVPMVAARQLATRLIEEPKFSIDRAFGSSVERIDFQHNLEQLVERVYQLLKVQQEREYQMSDSLRQALRRLRRLVKDILSA